MSKERKYIMHLDGDSFFVAVEASKNPALRNKAVVTGYERGIASAMSYEAKKLGITRAMPVFQIRKLHPHVIVVNSDYEAYAVFSRRMMDIVKRYTDKVHEYSIDECFADFTHIKSFTENPRPVLERIKSDIHKELGISVSLGLGPTKVIAKTASKRNKPNGLTIFNPEDVPELLAKTPIGSVWGIGSATTHELSKKGISTALNLASKPFEWVKEHFSKPLQEMWYELNCISVYEVESQYDPQKSIMKTRTFVPASNNREYVFSQLSKNVENAAKKLREMRMCVREISIYLKTQTFTYKGDSVRLLIPLENTFDILEQVKGLFNNIFVSDCLYRATGVTLYGLMPTVARQEDLFGGVEKEDTRRQLFDSIDLVNKKYGRSVVHVASSHRAIVDEEKGEREPRFMAKGFYKNLSVPYLGEVI